MTFYLLGPLGYLLALAAVALWQARRRARTADEFLVAARALPASMLVFTLLATWVGSGSLFAGAGLGYRVGAAALWQSAGAWLGILAVYFLAARVRRAARFTVPDLLELRYGAAARALGAVTLVFAYTTIAAYQFRGGGRLLQLVSGIDPFAGAAVTAAFCVVFTLMGGMASIARLDVANGLVMLAGLGLALAYLAGTTAPGGALRAVRPDQLAVFGALSPWEALGLFLPTACLLLGEATMYQKFSSARDERAARRAVAGWIAGTMAIESMIVALGLLGNAAHPGLTPAESETIVVRLATSTLPALPGLLVLAAAAAIIVSTASSMLLIPATSLTSDLYARFLRPGLSDRHLLRATQGAVVVLGAIGVCVGSFFPTILAMALWAYTMYGAGITPALLAALLWPRATGRAGVLSIAAGMIVTLGWELVALARGGTGDPAYPLGLQTIFPALAASVGVLVAATLIGGERQAGPPASRSTSEGA